MKNGLKKMMNGNLELLWKKRITQRNDVVNSLFELTKLPLCLLISFSAVFGFVMAKQNFPVQAFLLGFSVFLLAAGCAALNNIQDREYDAFFTRTQNRVLVKKRIKTSSAFLTAIFGITFGLLSLFFFFLNIEPFLLGVSALICYNLLYTTLKKKSLFCILPGTMSGMLPPLIGWTAAGGSMTDQTVIIIMMIMGIWQVPHFFLILLK